MTMAPSDTTPGEILRDTLAAHGVKAIHATDFRGPTITQHAFALEAGVKVAKVEALSKDLALALGLDDVRIVAPIPGTSYIGIEVPRATRENVTYNDMMTEPDFGAIMTGKAQALPFPVGVGIGGDPIWADLAKLPHLLIAGATGSGKSVALNSLITSLIDHKTPDEVRLWLVDPKRVELGIFADAPHVEQVATDIRDTVELLETVADIMDHRYQIFEDAGVRNIDEWNENANGEADYLPYHVVVVDELADLMMQAKADVEPLIVRIAQLARAAGIHLVLATQRPTVNVVTGLIAANVVSRWVFAVRSATDSKVALEQTGAQALYGQGDSLWFPAGASKPTRVQGVWTDSDTLRGILKAANETHPEPVSSASPRAEADDDTYDHTIDFETDNNFKGIWPTIIEDTTGLGTSYAPRHADNEIHGYDAMGATIAAQPEVDDLTAQLGPIINQMVDEAISERDRVKAVKRDKALAPLRKYALIPAAWIGGITAAIWVVGRVVGA